MSNYAYVWMILTSVFFFFPFKKKALGSVPRFLWMPSKHSSTELYYIPGGGGLNFESLTKLFNVALNFLYSQGRF